MRLSPIEPNDLSDDQRAFYEEMRRGIAKNYKDVQYETGSHALLGPFNPWLHEPDLGRAVWVFNRAIASPTSLPDLPREVATLVVGGHFRAAYEVESHRFYATRAGIPSDVVDRIIAGEKPDGLDAEQACAYDFAAALCAGGVVERSIYDAALRAFGKRGVSELTYLCGFYAVACMTMNAFDVAGPDMS